MARRRHKPKRKQTHNSPVSTRDGGPPVSQRLLPEAPAPESKPDKVVRRKTFGWVVRLARKTRSYAIVGRDIGRNSLVSIAELAPIRRVTQFLGPPDPHTRFRRRVRAALYSVLAIVALLFASRGLSRDSLSNWWMRIHQAVMPEPSASAPAEVASAPAGPAADEKLRRERPSGIKGGVLLIPSTFSSANGEYDLVLHFHGDVKIVLESVEAAKVNAVLGVINLGVGSGYYESAYTLPGTYEALLAQVQQVVEDRGLKGARLRRVALMSWSAGYGAISTILQVRQKKDPLDALLMADGLHCGRLPERPKEINFRQMAPFVEAAKAAANGKLLFSITHSDIDPKSYVPTAEAASYLLEAVKESGVKNVDLVAPERLKLKAAAFAVEPKLVKYLEPKRDVMVGSFHVRGFTGETTEDHVAHLTQMGATFLPELASRWAPAP
ncbi:MAG: hypothetical protein HY898_06140 [Deltaproteobacteria bacterium]|nr:hypothetical protein [Deltaproteobacteria bacterium]